MARYFLELSYSGKHYYGWQRQPGAVSIQQTVEERMSLLFRENIRLTVAGRTDAGVHALQTFAHFDTSGDFDTAEMRRKMNAFLPKDIAVHRIIPVKPQAHARFDAVERSYIYKIVTEKDPFQWDLAWEFFRPLDMEKMNRAAGILLEYTDFQSFSKVKTDVKTFLCDIREAQWMRQDEFLIFRIRADRFLRNMVRAIVGTLTEVGLGKIPPEKMHEIILAKDRGAAGASAPPQGLYLEKVVYPEHIFL